MVNETGQDAHAESAEFTDLLEILTSAVSKAADLYEEGGDLSIILKDLAKEKTFPLVFNDITYQVLYNAFFNLMHDVAVFRKQRNTLGDDIIAMGERKKVEAFLQANQDVFKAQMMLQEVDAGVVMQVVAAMMEGNVVTNPRDNDSPLTHITRMCIGDALRRKLKKGPHQIGTIPVQTVLLGEGTQSLRGRSTARLAKVLGVKDTDIMNQGASETRKALIAAGISLAPLLPVHPPVAGELTAEAVPDEDKE